MSKILFWCGLSLIAVICCGAYYFLSQATQLPDEYAESVQQLVDRNVSYPQTAGDIHQEAARTEQKISHQIQKSAVGQRVKVTVSDQELNYLVSSRLISNHDRAKFVTGVKTINTKIVAGKLHAGAIINLGELAQEAGSSEKSAVLSKLTEQLPFLKDRDIYVGIVGKPIVQDGRVKFDRDTQIKVGNMNLSIAQITTSLGVPEGKIEDLINLQLTKQKWQIDRVNLDDNKLKIEGKKDR